MSELKPGKIYVDDGIRADPNYLNTRYMEGLADGHTRRSYLMTEDLLTWLKCTTISACVLIVLVSAHLAVWLIERWVL